FCSVFRLKGPGSRFTGRGADIGARTGGAHTGINRMQVSLPRVVWRVLPLAAFVLCTAVAPAGAQDRGSVNPQALPPLANPDDPSTTAKELFGRKSAPAPLQARTIGFYSKGCLAGAKALPINGKTWQVMRLSRNRNWGHPNLIAFLERLASQAPKT